MISMQEGDCVAAVETFHSYIVFRLRLEEGHFAIKTSTVPEGRINPLYKKNLKRLIIFHVILAQWAY